VQTCPKTLAWRNSRISAWRCLEQRANARDSTAFLFRKKTFAWFLNDHHGDGMVSVACKALPGENTALAAGHPERFYMPPYIGPRGWVALRLDGTRVDWNEVGGTGRGELRADRG
jgi:hypothetical protein